MVHDLGRELTLLKRLLHDEIDHAAVNCHTLDSSSQGWTGPGVPVVRVTAIEAAIEGAERRVLVEGAGVDQPVTEPITTQADPGAGSTFLNVCQRCGTPLSTEGYCTDETCPYSDRLQDELERLAIRAQRDVLQVIEDLLYFNLRASTGHDDGAESFRQAFNRLCDLRDALMARDPDEADWGEDREIQPKQHESPQAPVRGVRDQTEETS